MKAESTVVVRPARNIGGSVQLPGDKSISHRYAMLGGIADGTTKLANFSSGLDCANTLACLWKLGVAWEWQDNHAVIRGCGGNLQAPTEALTCGNSGSTMRMMSGILAGQAFGTRLIGDESLSRRPMARVIAPLEAMGAKINAEDGGRPPLEIYGQRLRAIDYKMPMASAQVKSAVLFAGLFAEGETRVEEPLRTRDHSELALRAFGAEVKKDGLASSIRGGQKLHGIEATIPGDLSSAAFFLCAAALFPGSQLTVSNLLMNPTRSRLLDLLTTLGLKISVTQLEEQHGELVGTLQVEGRELKGIQLSGAESAALIDEIPVLAAIAPYTEDGAEIRDARELRVKESDRIGAVTSNLRRMGAQVEEFEDGFRIPGEQKLHGTMIDSFGDHRIAMAFAVAALRAEGETVIRGADAAEISYPEFFGTLEGLAQR
ncbi:MAG TPA: 3-phosphoshikimate 1-carboxyvinyltransferase [Terriglobales bacterium]